MPTHQLLLSLAVAALAAAAAAPVPAAATAPAPFSAAAVPEVPLHERQARARAGTVLTRGGRTAAKRRLQLLTQEKSETETETLLDTARRQAGNANNATELTSRVWRIAATSGWPFVDGGDRCGTEGAPYVVDSSGAEVVCGYAPALWDAVAARAAIRYEWVSPAVSASVAGGLAQLESGAADVVVGPISVLASREPAYTFSHAFFQGGVGYCAQGGVSVDSVLLSPFQGGMWGLVVGLTVFAAAFLILLERSNGAVVTVEFSKSWLGSIVDGLYYILTVIVGKAEVATQGLAGKIFMVTFIASVFVLRSLYFAQLTATLVSRENVAPLEEFRAIAESDLGVKGGGNLALQYPEAVQYDSAAEIIEGMVKEEIEAGLTDWPVLQAALLDNEDALAAGVVMGTQLLSTEPYAFVLAGNASAAKINLVNAALLQVFEEPDIVESLHRQYIIEAPAKTPGVGVTSVLEILIFIGIMSLCCSVALCAQLRWHFEDSPLLWGDAKLRERGDFSPAADHGGGYDDDTEMHARRAHLTADLPDASELRT